MKMACSNLSFKDEPLDEALKKCREYGITGLELAPGLIWDNPLAATAKDRVVFRQRLKDHGLRVTALQSVLFQQPDLQIFRDAGSRARCFTYLTEMIDLAGDLGADILSFGAYRNRQRFGMEWDQAIEIARDFFHDLAQYAKTVGVVVCLEPLSSSYGCDFICNVQEAVDLITRVGHKHFSLLFDTGSVLLDGGDPVAETQHFGKYIHHVHVNGPRLKEPALNDMDHEKFSQALMAFSYDGYVVFEYLSSALAWSSEMRAIVMAYQRTI